MKMHGDERQIEETFKSLIAQAVRKLPRPDLVVWPETSYPYWGFGLIHPKISSDELTRQAKEINPTSDAKFWRDHVDLLSRHLHEWTDQIGVPMLVGAIVHDFHPEGHSKYNSAVLFQPQLQAIQIYHKLHLVPFGEFVPLIDYLPWLTALTPYHGTHIPSLTFGRDPTILTLGPYRLATAICFEDTVPHVVRRFFHEAMKGDQPDLLVNLSNDGWFHGSSEHDMHLAASIFRAIENRVPLARAANTGISAVVDGNGRILEALPKLHEGFVVRTVPLDDRVSAYSAWGDWLGLSCLAVAIGLVPLSWIRSARFARTS
jgi:apolipoprotein N-acyltransferase